MLSLMQVAAALQGITIDLKASSQGLINLIIVSPPCSLFNEWPVKEFTAAIVF